MTSKSFDELNDAMLLRVLEINPDAATICGKHDPYDRHLPHGGVKRIQDNVSLLAEWTAKAGEAAKAEELSRDQTVSLQVLRMTLDAYRFATEDFPVWKMWPNAFEGPGSAMLLMLIRDYAPFEKRMDSMAHRLGEMPRYLQQFRDRFKGIRTPRVWTEPAVEGCRGFPLFLDMVEKQTRDKVSSEVMESLRRSAADVRSALEEHSRWMDGMLADSTDSFSMGRDKYEKLLRIKGIKYTADELLAIAERSLRQMQAEVATVARRISKGGTVQDALKIVESDSPDSTEEVVEMTKRETEKAKRYLIEHDIVTVPERSEVHVLRTPEFLENDVPTAMTFLPAFFDERQDSVYLVSHQGTKENLGAVWNNAAIVNTVVHEAFPGHHLQGVMSNTKPWMHQLPHIMYSSEALYPPYESQEGWAHYCELMMHGKGFCGSDRDAFAMLHFGIWRACRVFHDVKLASNEATVEEMIQWFMAEANSIRDPVEADVRGFCRSPGYGMSYLTGRHLVLELKKELLQTLGHEFSEKRFHDLVAQNGNLPFCLLEKEVKHGMGLKAE